MKITQVERQKRNPQRYNIYLDGQFAFGADEDLVVEHRLVAGKEVSPEVLEKLLFEAEVGKLMESMYRLFSIRQRSEKEVREYLKVKSQKLKVKSDGGISDLAVEALIKKLKDKGLVSDREFAKAWARARRKSKLKGPRAIKAELLQKGIDREVIEEVLTDASGGQNSDEQLALAALEKKLKLWHSLPVLEIKKKAYQYLARKGFDFEVIKVSVEKVLKKRYNSLRWESKDSEE